MPQRKKILIAIPNDLLAQMDGIAASDNQSRSELIREAIAQYVKQRRKLDLIQQMKKGYELMADINLEHAQNALVVDNEQLFDYEEKLMGCE